MNGACRVVPPNPPLLPMPPSNDFGDVTAPPALPPLDPSNLGLPKPVIREVLTVADPPKPPSYPLDDVDEMASLLPPPKPWMRLCKEAMQPSSLVHVLQVHHLHMPRPKQGFYMCCATLRS